MAQQIDARAPERVHTGVSEDLEDRGVHPREPGLIRQRKPRELGKGATHVVDRGGAV